MRRRWSLVLLLCLSGLLALPPAAATAQEASAETGRLSGVDRYATAAAIARHSFIGGSTPHVFLARGDDSPDAFAAGMLTTGPLLLVPPTCGEVPDSVHQAIADLKPEKVYALGGSAAVCNITLREVAGSREVGRLAGDDRYETSVEISQFVFSTALEVFLASGTGSPDAVVAGVLDRGPILLTPDGDDVPPAIRAEIERLDPLRVNAIGGPAAVSEQMLERAGAGRERYRVFGVDRYETAVAISETQFRDPAAVRTVYLARGDEFADALAAGSLTDGPILLTPSCGPLPSVVAEEIQRVQPFSVFALGGHHAVCDDVLEEAAELAG